MVNFWTNALLLASSLIGAVQGQAGGSRIYTTGVQNGVTATRMQCSKITGDLQRVYILAMQQMMKRGWDKWDSFMRVSAIHGTDLSYNGEQGGSWCHHGERNFLTWHRIYLAHFEQMLYTAGQDVCNSYTAGSAANTKCTSTLRNLRLCYIDWATEGIPDWFQVQFVYLNMPNGSGGEMSAWMVNPMRKFTLAPNQYNYPALQFDGAQYGTWCTTTSPYRNTTNNYYYQNDQATQQSLSRNRASIKNGIYRSLTLVNRWNQFSYYGPSTSSDNIESLHNSCHVWIGNNGHMSYPDSAAFDPIFMHHHCWIDLNWAKWQILWPDQQIDNNDQMVPFYSRSTGSYWTAANTKSWTQFGYTYADTESAPSASTMRQLVERQYGSASGTSAVGRAVSSSALKKRQNNGENAGMDNGNGKDVGNHKGQAKNAAEDVVDKIGQAVDSAVKKIDAVVEGVLNTPPDINALASAVSHAEQLANVTSEGTISKDYKLACQLNTGACSTSFTCGAFFDTFDASNMESWPEANGFCGQFAVFTDKKLNKDGTFSVPLVNPLLQAINQKALPGLGQHNVTQYLTKFLRYGCKANSLETDVAVDVSGFKCVVLMTDIKVPDANQVITEAASEPVEILTVPNTGSPANPDLVLNFAEDAVNATATNATATATEAAADVPTSAPTSGMADLSNAAQQGTNNAEQAPADNSNPVTGSGPSDTGSEAGSAPEAAAPEITAK